MVSWKRMEEYQEEKNGKVLEVEPVGRNEERANKG
jgi:hypothetical protein